MENNDFRPVCGYFAASPPSRNPKPFENRVYILLRMRSLTALPHPELFWKTMIFFLFVATSLRRRLRVTPNRLKIVFSFFLRLWRH
ncbi:hypothetical protein [Cronobacter sakazakii]|uniref:hypothetical protein n=1 Tax=Cronobacter sakazakii TaxID=28141 RepID=UPI001070D8CA|nr:hypothetical protein [Cronobacter sakazakii]EKK3983748.1 hypothetical protein [Cronobacter sakazakii]ELY2550643.1 hypothetical protein [Cronobacter sakazakii]ELY6402725.1 hypothetical protein [Cronobacter sakazakii]MBF4817428.1 hypothetical protein [Cronobacter sakazakii]MDT3570227.1 hypothetical protein [Cronobacter sakazakii]